MQIELIYEKTCPNIEAARSQLLRAFCEVGITPQWKEWEVSSPDAPKHIHGYGSPTILVNGQDVSGNMTAGNDYCCRVYSHDEETNKGVPAAEDIMQALKSQQQPVQSKKNTSRISLNSAILPTVGVALLPKLVCPACWPAYAGLLSTLGISFVDYTPYLIPLTVVFLLIAIVSLAYRAKQRHGYKPLLIGLVATGIVLTGKFYYDNDITMYLGLFLLVVASLWNTWPTSHASNASCTACENLAHKPVIQQ
ncbi:MAG: MerC family mercury resistance protein [gamma proteobacterium symbiont of Bathyaustriella thionipta]|nr:MerC family mercury resistance protein [gamma proteobacterium symbiont of Bathyaustriella thionipta]MCU7949736.1 MerC family mercury resistance protein [gamma proteobacterium symbiont of Bathyaustriella thionipta]MCU7952852.1 MerC family mercury resistance protein [gamma proteobacterium symbiont of Bathyaustriella thionipta]MCU7956318.1 MerC family mercury resistance protein [gamma proteobacterium symbiont of Bathyaustriella thionipta]MCU7968470.1 MerC family mercury resistance protein [gamm